MPIVHFLFSSHLLIYNRFLLFDNFRISRHNHLSKLGEINDDGKFITTIKDNRKRLGASFGSLSDGRVAIAGMYYI